MDQNAGLRRAVSLIVKAGYQIDKEAFELLKGASKTIDLDSLIRDIIKEADKLSNYPLFINRELLERKIKEQSTSKNLSTLPAETGKTTYEPYAKEIEANLKILEDPTEKISTTGSIEDYIQYFQDRFRKLRRIMNQRMDVRHAYTIQEALEITSNTEVKIICMITEKRESKRGIFLQVDDAESRTTVFVPSENSKSFQKAQMLILDQVACICATKGKGKFLIAKDIIFPNVPLKKPNKASIPVSVALLSDLHVGSKMFMRNSFERFILWLKGKIGNTSLKRIASHVKYVIIAGDIVDGVGIYPHQIEELEIEDVYEQYQVAAKMIEQIPEYIEVIMIPGNHDACRRSLPQPAIPKEYAEPLYDSRRLCSLGNPAGLSLHGVNVLLCHGRSLDDIITNVPKMSFKKPDMAMKFLLQCRHLAPAYGLRTLISSEKTDHLVIERVPDIFHMGHVHLMSYSTYRGILVANSGAWQKQTEYQREMGHTPNPGISPIVNLKNLQVTPINFTSN